VSPFTAMSPLQFQKRIRLQEARRLMLAEQVDAANAGFRVGYEDPSYFSRQYKELFGAPPQRDISRLRGRETVRACLLVMNPTMTVTWNIGTI
jgi:AraC-like DNA-binding protein